MTNALTLTYNK